MIGSIPAVFDAVRCRYPAQREQSFAGALRRSRGSVDCPMHLPAFNLRLFVRLTRFGHPNEPCKEIIHRCFQNDAPRYRSQVRPDQADSISDDSNSEGKISWRCLLKRNIRCGESDKNNSYHRSAMLPRMPCPDSMQLAISLVFPMTLN